MMKQMLDYTEFNSHHNKVIRVIQSCLTLEQLENAQKFKELAIRFHLLKMKDDRSTRSKYQSVIEESSELLTQAIRDHRKKILGGMKQNSS